MNCSVMSKRNRQTAMDIIYVMVPDGNLEENWWHKRDTTPLTESFLSLFCISKILKIESVNELASAAIIHPKMCTGVLCMSAKATIRSSEF